jgi:hypothetical protein
MDSWPLGVESLRGKIQITSYENAHKAQPTYIAGTIRIRDGLPYIRLSKTQERRLKRHFCSDPRCECNSGDLIDITGHYRGISVYVIGKDEHRWPICENCFQLLREDDDIYVEESGIFCESCYIQLYNKSCGWCEEWFQEGDVREARDCLSYEVYVCKDCLKNHFEDCDECGFAYPTDALKPAVGWGNKAIRVCPECLKGFHLCVTCNRYVDASLVDGSGECTFCYDSKMEDKGGEK